MGSDGLRPVALFAVVLCAACGGMSTPAGTATVDSVRDGDTILLENDRRVRLVQVDAPELGVECWGRLLRYVYADGRNLTLELVRIGAAAPYFYRGERGRYARRLLAAAREARTERRGLWGACPGTRLLPERQVATGRS